MKIAILALTAVLFISPAFGQQGSYRTQIQDEEDRQVRDLPLGAPYRTGEAQGFPNRGMIVDASVPLRDFLSKSIDGVRAEILNRLDQQEQYFFRIINERDRQYAQRFDAQQEALAAALLSAKEAVANALAAAKEAVVKAEDAANKRFDSVNEFRAQLDDQANTFLRKDAADARFNGIIERTDALTARLNAYASEREGAAGLWGYIIGIVGLFLVLATFAASTVKSLRNEIAVGQTAGRTAK